MITVGVNTGKKSFYNMAEFLCDFQTDVANLPTNRGVGSRAYVIENGNVYIFNSEKVWVLQPNGEAPSPDDTIIYDGGEVS